MVALDFPSSPSNGQVFGQYVYDGTKAVWRLNPEAPNSNLDNLNDVTITTPLDEQALIYNTATGNWINAAVAGGVEVSATAPAAPSAGDLWWNSTIGDLFVYYNDGTSSQWVPTSGPTVTVSDVAPTGYDGQLWLDSTDGSMYVYYTDPGGAASSWIGAVSRSGGILQVVSAIKTDAVTATTGVSTWADIPGLSLTVTPSSTSSKILVTINTMMGETTNDFTMFRIVRDTTPIGIGDANGSRNRAMTSSYAGTATTNAFHSTSGTVLDTPATTATTTYKLQWTTGSLPGYLNRNARYSNNHYDATYVSTITLMEVAG